MPGLARTCLAAAHAHLPTLAPSAQGQCSSLYAQLHSASLTPATLSCLPARRLDACAVAGILTGNITEWDDPALAELNPEVGAALHLCHSQSYCSQHCNKAAVKSA